MKIPCPFCTEKIAYDPALAGKTIQCSYCQRPLLIPPLAKLPREYQEEFRAEQERLAAKQEKQRRKEIEQQRQERERQREEQEWLIREGERMKEEAQQQLQEQSHRQKWASAVTQAQKEVPEDGVAANSYPVLKSIVGLYKAGAIIVGILALIAILVALANIDSHAPSAIIGTVVVGIVGIIISAGFMILVLLLAAESIILFVNMADDIRVDKALLKRIAYRSSDLDAAHSD
jgi:ABC-type multidrug transport system fused ATPase/permease subunit